MGDEIYFCNLLEVKFISMTSGVLYLLFVDPFKNREYIFGLSLLVILHQNFTEKHNYKFALTSDHSGISFVHRNWQKLESNKQKNFKTVSEKD